VTRALVTGATGFVAANLSRRLLANGWEVELVAQPGSDSWRLEEIRSDVTLHEVDVTDAQAVDAVVAATTPSHVFHLAAHGAYSWQTDAARILATNLLGTLNVLESSVRHGCESVINTGSSSEYGYQDHAPSETELPVPNSHYAVAKVAATMLSGYLGRSTETRICTLRLYSVYGEFEEPGRLMPALVLEALRGQLPPLVDPSIARDFVQIEDVVDAFLVASAEGRSGEVYNVGSGTQTSLAELVEICGEVFGFVPEPQWGSMPARSWDTNTWIANVEKARQELGWSAQRGLPEGLRSFGNWLESSPELRGRYEPKTDRS
jgi:dolichol-phosphate mannosyltransferase